MVADITAVDNERGYQHDHGKHRSDCQLHKRTTKIASWVKVEAR